MWRHETTRDKHAKRLIYHLYFLAMAPMTLFLYSCNRTAHYENYAFYINLYLWLAFIYSICPNLQSHGPMTFALRQCLLGLTWPDALQTEVWLDICRTSSGNSRRRTRHSDSLRRYPSTFVWSPDSFGSPGSCSVRSAASLREPLACLKNMIQYHNTLQCNDMYCCLRY